MSPFDMLIFLFFILATIKAASACVSYWTDPGTDTVSGSSSRAAGTSASLSRTVRTGRPSSVRVTPIKKADTPVPVSTRGYIISRQTPLKDKGAA